MSETVGGEEQPTLYAVRVSPRADLEMVAAALALEALIGEEAAREWYRGMRAAVASLQQFPRRHPVQAPESRRVGAEARRLLYRGPTGRGAAAGYHLYYLVEDETEDGPREDGPRVVVFHVRHAARRPITPAEGRAIREEL